MTTNPRSQPVGPLASTDSVVLVTYQEPYYYVAGYDSLAGDLSFYPYLSPNSGTINPNLTESTIMKFGLAGTPQAPVLRALNTKLAGYVVQPKIVSGKSVLSLAETNTSPIGVTSKYSDPPTGNVFLSSAPYVFSTSQGVAMYVRYRPSSSINKLAYAQLDVVPLPVIIYPRGDGDSSKFTCSKSSSDSLYSIRTYICSVCVGDGCGSKVENCLSIPQVSWTRAEDCVRDVNFNYCTNGQKCGTCYGPCTGSEDCVFSQSTPYFTCSSNGGFAPLGPAKPPSPPPPPPPISDYTWWIVGAVVVFVILGVLAYVLTRGTNEGDNYDSYDDDYNYDSSIPIQVT